MEEVWKGVSLSSFGTSPMNLDPSSANQRVCHGMIFQDFFSPRSAPPKFNLNSTGQSTNFQLQSPPAEAPVLPPPIIQQLQSPPPPPAISLSLTPCGIQTQNPAVENNQVDQEQIFNTGQQHPPAFMSSLSSPIFDALASSDSLITPFCKKTGGGEEKDDKSGGDPRYKRMMKNRESAARSRARRQAYTFELERERAQLIEENEKLRRKLSMKLDEEKMRADAAAPVEILRARTPIIHMRSLTAPF